MSKLAGECQGSQVEQAKARYVVFYDYITQLNDLDKEIVNLLQTLTGDADKDGGTGSTARSVDNIESASVLLGNLKDILNSKYCMLAARMDDLINCLHLSDELNLMKDKNEKESVPETEHSTIDTREVSVLIQRFIDVYHTLDNIHLALTTDIDAFEPLDKHNINLDDLDKSVNGIFEQGKIIDEFVGMSYSKLGEIKSVFI